MKKANNIILSQWKSNKLIDLITLHNYSYNDIVGFLIKNKIYDIRDEFLYNNEEIFFIEKTDPQGEDIIRHSMAHILAESLIEIDPSCQIIIGPTTSNGFFYDVDLNRQLNFNDLQQLEKKMKQIIDNNEIIHKKTIKKTDAIELFINKNQTYKVNIIQSINDDVVTIYTQNNFTDLCRGPHVYSTGVVGKGFKLYNISQVDWKPKSVNEKNRIQRIYSYGFNSYENLEKFFLLQEEKKKYDHRKIGIDNEIFSFHPEFCSGGVFWEKNGAIIYNELINFIRKMILDNGYFEVKTPNIYNENLWKLSGHWDHYQDNMFKIPVNDNENYDYLSLKPMNCPAHIILFKSRIRSYKDLPLRMAEFGSCCRNESSGSLDGIMRTREFIQDDAHIFCRESQIQEEIIKFCNLLKIIYEKLGFNNIRLVISTRPEKSFGDDNLWIKAEKALQDAMEVLGWDYIISPGDGAFYGPKLEISLQDKLGRYWQCGTFQLDFVLPQRMGAYYINENSQEEHPVICHRAILGSLERFLGVFIENNKGYWPFWLAPVQINILTIGENQQPYGQKVYDILKNYYRCQLNNDNETLGKKIKLSIDYKIPIMIIVGSKEMEQETIMMRNISGNSENCLLKDSLNSINNFIVTHQLNIIK